MGWTQIVLGGLNRTSVIEHRSVESGEQFGSTIVPHITSTTRMFADDTNVSYVADSVDGLQNVLLMANRLSLKYCKNRVYDDWI